jgi:hypothetical protein
MLNASHHRGFTLVEIVLSVVMTAVVTGAIYNLLFNTQRLTRLQGERVSLQASVRAGSLILREELSELSTVVGGTVDQNDIIAAGPSAISYRAMRGLGLMCEASSAPVIRLARSTFSGHRDPQAGRDKAFVFIPGSLEAETNDTWVPAGIVSVGTTAPCPGGLGAGITLTISAGVPLGTLESGTPVRITELMELRLYRSEGRSWLGARSVSTGETIQPLVGPLDDADGFSLDYLDGTGAPTADPTRIRSIRGKLKGIADGSGTGSAVPIEEELITQIALRNASQP